MIHPEDFIKDQLPVKYWHVIPTILKTAYKAADQLIKDSPILQVESAEDNKGRFISYAVDFFLVQAIENGSLACDFRWVPFAKPTGRYLELKLKHSTMSISQVPFYDKQPRNVVFREHKRFGSMETFDFLEFQEELEISGLPHFLLVHGYQSLDFSHIGMPSSFSKTKYVWQSQNLMNLPYEIVEEGPMAENTDFDLNNLNLLKQDIEKWSKDNGNKG